MTQRLFFDSIEIGENKERKRILEILNNPPSPDKIDDSFFVDEDERKEFEIYLKGFNAGVQVERERILELINKTEIES